MAAAGSRLPAMGISQALTSRSDGYAPAGPPSLVADSIRALRETLADEAPDLVPRLDAATPDWALEPGPARARGGAAGELVPDIDYARHPYYRDFADQDETARQAAADRFFEMFRYLLDAEQALALRSARSGRHRRPEDAPRSEALKTLEETGVYSFRLSPSKLGELIERSQPAVDALDARRRGLTPEQRGVEGVLEPLADRKTAGEAFEFYDDMLRSEGIYELVQQYYGCPVKFMGVTLQITTGEDRGLASICSYPDGRRAPSYYMHMDSSAGSLKILMYRSEPVTRRNGAFRYLEGSHSALDPVERAIRKANDKSGVEKLKPSGRQLFMGLPPCLRRKANFGNDLLPETGFDAERLVERETICEGEPGQGFLADVNGVHRGNLHEDEGGRREMFKFLLKAAL